MAKSTYLELVNRTLQECAISGGDAASVVDQTGIREKVVTWVKEADLYVQRLYRDWNFLHTSHSDTTIASTKDYTKPSNLGMWDRDSFYLNYTASTYVHLEELSYEEWRESYGVGTQTNDKPAYFVIKPNKNIILYSPPDAAYTLTADYWKVPTKLSGNSDTSDIPEHFEDIIIRRAMLLYAQHEEAQELLSYAAQEYQVALVDLKANELSHMTALNQASIDVVVSS